MEHARQRGSSDDEADGIEYRIFLLHKNDYRIVDTWHSSGLRGTGSNDVEVDDAFVAEAMTLAVSDLDGGPTPGSAVNPNALYALPVFSLFRMCCLVLPWVTRRPVSTIMSMSRGIAHRPTTAPSSAISRARRSRSRRRPPRSMRHA